MKVRTEHVVPSSIAVNELSMDLNNISVWEALEGLIQVCQGKLEPSRVSVDRQSVKRDGSSC